MIRLLFCAGMAVVLAAPIEAQEIDYSTKQGCVAEATESVSIAELWMVFPRYAKSHSTIPDSGIEHRDAIFAALDEIEVQYQIITDEWFALCQLYPAD